MTGLRAHSYCWACKFILFDLSDTVCTLTVRQLSTEMFIILARILSPPGAVVRFVYVGHLNDQCHGCKCTICHSLMEPGTNLSRLIPVWLFAFSLFIYLSGWLNATAVFLLRRHISFSWIPLSVLCFFVCLTLIFPIHFVSVSACHSLSPPLTSLQSHALEKTLKQNAQIFLSQSQTLTITLCQLEQLIFRTIK